MRNTFSDTIVAPATNIAKQAICIIRISGEHAFKIVNQSLAKKIEAQPQTVLRNFFDGDVLLDQVLLLTFVAPNSFTGEDVIEINCHGGVLVAKKIMETIIRNGARIAERGEFSKRAFLNQKISLIQAQGINDLIEAKNDLALRISAKNMAGKTNAIVNILKNNVMDIISQVQTAIDYPEYEETENITPIEIGQQIKELNVKLLKALEISKRASVANNGLKTVIFGKPNVGKSSLLNALLNEDKAIVSDEMGTTRDIVEGEITPKKVGVSYFCNVGFDVKSSKRALTQALKYKEVYAAVGIHPNEAHKVDIDLETEEIETLANGDKVVAIGEIGLDYFHNGKKYRDQQIKLLELQIDVAKKHNFPVALHIRDEEGKEDAYLDALEIIDRKKVKSGIIHCYTQGPELAQKFIERGFYISIPGIVTFKSAKAATLLTLPTMWRT
jgi:tRNA modification GTPase